MTGTKDQTTFTPADTNAWIHELDIFRELKAINKPVNQNAYRVEHNLPDSRSNLKIRSITAKEEKELNKNELPIRSMKIYYQDRENRVRKIEAWFKESNTLYTSTRFLSMEFQDIHNKTVLSSYSIEGGQKMFMADSVTYRIVAAVSLPE